jgi:hypothetical protein
MSLLAKLTMTCTVTAVSGQDTSGDQIYGTVTSGVKCFLFGNRRRFRNEKLEEYSPDFQMLFLPGTDIGINYLIDDVIDLKGTPVLEHGQVNKTEDNFHPKRGLVLSQAFVSAR